MGLAGSRPWLTTSAVPPSFLPSEPWALHTRAPPLLSPTHTWYPLPSPPPPPTPTAPPLLLPPLPPCTHTLLYPLCQSTSLATTHETPTPALAPKSVVPHRAARPLGRPPIAADSVCPALPPHHHTLHCLCRAGHPPATLPSPSPHITSTAVFAASDPPEGPPPLLSDSLFAPMRAAGPPQPPRRPPCPHPVRASPVLPSTPLTTNTHLPPTTEQRSPSRIPPTEKAPRQASTSPCARVLHSAWRPLGAALRVDHPNQSRCLVGRRRRPREPPPRVPRHHSSHPHPCSLKPCLRMTCSVPCFLSKSEALVLFHLPAPACLFPIPGARPRPERQFRPAVP